MAAKGDSWECVDGDFRSRANFAHFLRPETPFVQRPRISGIRHICYANALPVRALRLASEDAQLAPLLRRSVHQFFFSSWDTCVEFERREDGNLTETIFYSEYSRITRGVYWLLRPMCFVSASLLVIALLSVACNSGKRHKAHCWCLACHAACLLAFNLGQVTYFLTISDEIDSSSLVPFYLKNTCRKIALAMYFVSTAANCWLAALCFNMAWGFRKLQVARPGGGGGNDRKRFLALSAFAWGLPIVMTASCAHAFEEDTLSLMWYSPSLAETRTCFNELSGVVGNDSFR